MPCVEYENDPHLKSLHIGMIEKDGNFGERYFLFFAEFY